MQCSTVIGVSCLEVEELQLLSASPVVKELQLLEGVVFRRGRDSAVNVHYAVNAKYFFKVLAGSHL